MITLQGLSFAYHEDRECREVLHQIDLTIEEGQWLTMLGRNGSGKTTLAMCLNGLLSPSAGRVTVDGYDTADREKVYRLRQIIAYVFQNPDNQIIGATVEEDIAFGPENLGLPSAEIRERVEESLQAVGMAAYRHHAPHLLSGGQKQKVAVAGALAMRPRYLILDEATSMLDPHSRRELYEAVAALHRTRGIAVINISHFPEEILWGERVIVMDQGRLALDLAKEALFRDVEQLSAHGVDLPEILSLGRALLRRGLCVDGNPLTVAEMVTALWP